MKDWKYKWDGTDGHTMKNFRIAIYDREMSVLNEYDFELEPCKDTFNEEELVIISDLRNKGMLYSFTANGKEYYGGTVLYKQLKG